MAEYRKFVRKNAPPPPVVAPIDRPAPTAVPTTPIEPVPPALESERQGIVATDEDRGVVAPDSEDHGVVTTPTVAPRPVPIEPLPPALAALELWRSGFASLDPLETLVPGFPSDAWRRIHREASRFLNGPLARIAAEQNWTTLELLGVHRVVGAARLDQLGALLCNSHGVAITQVATSLLRFGNGLAWRRVPMNAELCVPVWDFAAPDRSAVEPPTDRTCRQCFGPVDGREHLVAIEKAPAVWLHPQCESFYLQQHGLKRRSVTETGESS